MRGGVVVGGRGGVVECCGVLWSGVAFDASAEEGGAHRNSHRPFALLNMQKGTRAHELQVV